MDTNLHRYGHGGSDASCRTGAVAEEASMTGSSEFQQAATSTPTTQPDYTPEEQEILAGVAGEKSWEWVNRHADLILAQARSVGQL
jgi:hypothetical protein